MSTVNLLPINDPQGQAAFSAAVQQLRNLPVLGVVVETTIKDGKTFISGWRLADAQEVADMALSLAVLEDNQQS